MYPGETEALRRLGQAYRVENGGAEGNRTPDLVNAIHALSQLSYSPNGLRNYLQEAGLSKSPRNSENRPT